MTLCEKAFFLVCGLIVGGLTLIPVCAAVVLYAVGWLLNSVGIIRMEKIGRAFDREKADETQ